VNGVSVVNFGGAAKTTTFVSATQLTASILAADIATAGVKPVTVTNPAPGGGTSTPVVNFTVTAANNPVPTVTTLSPTNVNVGSAQFTLTVNGTGFVSTSVVNFNGTAKATTFLSATQLTATILAADVATAGTPGVTVTNPTPGGGTSTPAVTFTINAANTGTITVSGTNPAAILAGGSGTSTITVTPTGGTFTGTVAVTCAATATSTSLAQVGLSCTPNPLNISVAGSTAASLPLTISVAANSTNLGASNFPATPQALPNAAKTFVMVGAGTGFAALFLLFLPGRKRLRAALGLGLVCLISLALGCGGGGGGGMTGPVATHTAISVASSKVASTSTFSFTVAVTGGTTTPTGTVQLFDGATPLGNAIVIDSNGMAMSGIIPPTGVGTHAISAHYAGDSAHMASASGSLQCTVTGTTNLTISGTSGSTMKTGTISITVN
jgi:hypothetical protein